jgi:hypothetical protein
MNTKINTIEELLTAINKLAETQRKIMKQNNIEGSTNMFGIGYCHALGDIKRLIHNVK